MRLIKFFYWIIFSKQPKVSCSAWYHWFRTQPTETEPTENYETQDPSDHHLTSTLNPSFQRSNNSYLPESVSGEILKMLIYGADCSIWC